MLEYMIIHLVYKLALNKGHRMSKMLALRDGFILSRVLPDAGNIHTARQTSRLVLPQTSSTIHAAKSVRSVLMVGGFSLS